MKKLRLHNKLVILLMPSVILIIFFYLNNSAIAQITIYSWTEKDNSGHNFQYEQGLFDHGMAYLGDDKVLMFGGMDQGRLQDTVIYDLSENTWIFRNPYTLPENRMDFGMAHIGDDKALIFGGNRAYATWLNDTWVYDYNENSWTELFPATSPSARRSLAMSFIGDDKVLLLGGYTGTSMGDSDETWVYDLSENAWTLMNPSTKPPKRDSHSMAYIGEDKVILFGGCLVPGTQKKIGVRPTQLTELVFS